MKMQQNIFSLRWKYFQTNISSSLSNLYKDTSSTDVTLVSDDQIQFQAHKFVLSACSPVLKNFLLNNPHSHPLIYLRGVKQQELGSILQFMYHGEAAIHLNTITMFLQNAQDFQIKQLADCFMTGNTFDKENAANSDDVPKNDDIDNTTNLNIHSNH